MSKLFLVTFLSFGLIGIGHASEVCKFLENRGLLSKISNPSSAYKDSVRTAGNATDYYDFDELYRTNRLSGYWGAIPQSSSMRNSKEVDRVSIKKYSSGTVRVLSVNIPYKGVKTGFELNRRFLHDYKFDKEINGLNSNSKPEYFFDTLDTGKQVFNCDGFIVSRIHLLYLAHDSLEGDENYNDIRKMLQNNNLSYIQIKAEIKE